MNLETPMGEQNKSDDNSNLKKIEDRKWWAMIQARTWKWLKKKKRRQMWTMSPLECLHYFLFLSKHEFINHAGGTSLVQTLQRTNFNKFHYARPWRQVGRQGRQTLEARYTTTEEAWLSQDLIGWTKERKQGGGKKKVTAWEHCGATHRGTPLTPQQCIRGTLSHQPRKQPGVPWHVSVW